LDWYLAAIEARGVEISHYIHSYTIFWGTWASFFSYRADHHTARTRQIPRFRSRPPASPAGFTIFHAVMRIGGDELTFHDLSCRSAARQNVTNRARKTQNAIDVTARPGTGACKMNDVTIMDRPASMDSRQVSQAAAQPVVVVVSDDPTLSRSLETICEFLEISVEYVTTDEDIAVVLRDYNPMALVGEVDGRGQDGFHVMMTLAGHDRDLPFLLLTGGDPIAAGAADAVEELWGLTSVIKSAELPKVGQLVDFLFRAGRRANCLGLMPT
jgi:Flagellar regulatory protein FleQ